LLSTIKSSGSCKCFRKIFFIVSVVCVKTVPAKEQFLRIIIIAEKTDFLYTVFMKTKRIILLDLISVALLCAPVAAQQGENIKITSIIPQSGVLESYGLSEQLGMELAVNKINSNGGINGSKIELVVKDDKADPMMSEAICKKAVANGEKLIIGSLTSGCAAKDVEALEQSRTIFIAPAATGKFATADNPYVFRACDSDAYLGKKVVTFARKNLSAKRAVIFIYEENEYSVALAEKFRTDFSVQGGAIVSEVTYDLPIGVNNSVRDKQIMTMKIASLVHQKCDVIYIPDYYNSVAALVSQIRAAGITAPIVGCEGWQGIEKMPEMNADVLKNCYYAVQFCASNPAEAVKQFTTAFNEKYGSDYVMTFAALGYDCVYLLANAITAAGGCSDIAKVRGELAKTDGRYVTGKVSFDKDRDAVKSVTFVNAYDASFFAEVE